MTRFCAHLLRDGGYVLDCQSDLFEHLTTRFVVPLVPIEHVEMPMTRLNPCFDMDGNRFVMMTQFSGAITARSLGKVVKSFAEQDHAIIAALDMLITGF